MIDRAARDRVRRAIDDFLDERTTNFEFEARLEEIDSDDRTVNMVAFLLWHFYDDLREHRVCLDKAGWDAMQRISLLLQSDLHAEQKVTRRSHASQWIALGMIAMIAAMGFIAGWPFAWLAGVLTSPVYFVLRAWREEASETLHPLVRQDIWPFGSFGIMRIARTQAATFRKRQFRREIGGRKIHSELWVQFHQTKLSLLQAVGAMFLYAFQCFPISRDWIEITPAADASAI
jgi:hypothetical protein